MKTIGTYMLRIGLATTIALTSSATAASALHHAQIPCRYHAQQIVPPPCSGAAYVFASAISPNGRYVCGYWFCNAGADRPFVWIAPEVPGVGQPGTFIPINIPGFVIGYANDVNDVGTVVGRVASGTLGDLGFAYDLHTGASMLLHPINPQGICSATGVNSHGEVCGYRSIGSKSDPVNPVTAFRWSSKTGVFEDLGVVNGHSTTASAINNFRTVAISTGFTIDAGSLGYLWHSDWLESVGPIPGGLTSGMADLNDAGWALVGGMVQSTPLVLASFLRKPDGTFIPLPAVPNLFNPGIKSITKSGVVGGWCHQSPSIPTPRATLWHDGQPVSLLGIIEPTPAHVLYQAIVADSEAIAVDGFTDHHTSFYLSSEYGLPGDTNCDSRVDVDDFVTVILDWGPCPGCNGDLTRDGQSDVEDLIQVLLNWGAIGGVV